MPALVTSRDPNDLLAICAKLGKWWARRLRYDSIARNLRASRST